LIFFEIAFDFINFKLRPYYVMSIIKLMESKKNLVLVGMMGSGKSTIGTILAKKLKYEFIDIDNKIEKIEKLTISEIFEQKGENYFRKIEEKISNILITGNKKVISLGGGGFNNNNIQKKILTNNISFWLNWKNSTIINRIKNNKKRPLVTNLNEKELKKLIKLRDNVYVKADYKVDCENLTKNEISEKIKEIYEKL